MASFNKTSQNSNKNSSRFAILRENGFVDDDSDESPMTATSATQENAFEVKQLFSRTYSCEKDESIESIGRDSQYFNFANLERGNLNNNFVAEFAKSPAFFDSFNYESSPIYKCGGGFKDEIVEEEPLHIRLNIPGPVTLGALVNLGVLVADSVRGAATKAPKVTKTGGSARPIPPRCASWPSAETILADLAMAVPHKKEMVASVTYTLEEGTPREFAIWCMSATGIDVTRLVTAKKDGKRRVRIFAGDKPGHVNAAFYPVNAVFYPRSTC